MSFFLLRFSRRKAAIYPMAFLFHVDQFYLVMRATPTSKARIYRLLLFAVVGWLACCVCRQHSSPHQTSSVYSAASGIGESSIISLEFSLGWRGSSNPFRRGGGEGGIITSWNGSQVGIYFSFLDREARRLRITKWRWIVMRILTLSDLSPPIFDTADRRL